MRLLTGWQLWVEDVFIGTYDSADLAQDKLDTIPDVHMLDSVEIVAVFREE